MEQLNLRIALYLFLFRQSQIRKLCDNEENLWALSEKWLYSIQDTKINQILISCYVHQNSKSDTDWQLGEYKGYSRNILKNLSKQIQAEIVSDKQQNKNLISNFPYEEELSRALKLLLIYMAKKYKFSVSEQDYSGAVRMLKIKCRNLPLAKIIIDHTRKELLHTEQDIDKFVSLSLPLWFKRKMGCVLQWENIKRMLTESPELSPQNIYLNQLPLSNPAMRSMTEKGAQTLQDVINLLQPDNAKYLNYLGIVHLAALETEIQWYTYRENMPLPQHEKIYMGPDEPFILRFIREVANESNLCLSNPLPKILKQKAEKLFHTLSKVNWDYARYLFSRYALELDDFDIDVLWKWEYGYSYSLKQTVKRWVDNILKGVQGIQNHRNPFDYPIESLFIPPDITEFLNSYCKQHEIKPIIGTIFQLHQTDAVYLDDEESRARKSSISNAIKQYKRFLK